MHFITKKLLHTYSTGCNYHTSILIGGGIFIHLCCPDKYFFEIKLISIWHFSYESKIGQICSRAEKVFMYLSFNRCLQSSQNVQDSSQCYRRILFYPLCQYDQLPNYLYFHIVTFFHNLIISLRGKMVSNLHNSLLWPLQLLGTVSGNIFDSSGLEFSNYVHW